MEHSVALPQVSYMCVRVCVDAKYFILMLAMISVMVYLVWSMKNLYRTIRKNQKGGEY